MEKDTQDYQKQEERQLKNPLDRTKKKKQVDDEVSEEKPEPRTMESKDETKKKKTVAGKQHRNIGPLLKDESFGTSENNNESVEEGVLVGPKMADGLFETPAPIHRAPAKPKQGPCMKDGLFKKITDSDLAIMGIEDSIQEAARARAVPPPEHLAAWNHPLNSTVSSRNNILAGDGVGSSDGGRATAEHEHVPTVSKDVLQKFDLPLRFGSYPKKKKNGRGRAQ